MIKNPSKQTCAYCGMSFQFPSELKRHLMVHDGEEEEEEEEEDLGIVATSISVSPAPTTKQDRTCQICGEFVHFPSQMKRHMLNHTGEMTFQCHKCKVVFSSRKNLKIHCVRKHGKSTPPDKASRRVEKAAKDTCLICRKLWWSPSLLKRHMRVHTGEKPFKCDRCGRSFSLKHNAQRHLITHTGEKPFECDLCGRSFSLKVHVQRHMRVHTGGKPFKCDHCSRSFSSKGNVQRHMRMHTGGKPFECDVCPAKFSLKGALKKHCVRVHKNAVGKESSRMHICPLCGTFFKYLYLLNRHMTVHSQSSEKQFECEVCHKYFTRKGNLKTHLKKIHMDPATSPSEKTFECDVCNRTFTRKASLNAHRKKMHMDLAAEQDRTCPICGLVFDFPSRMKWHMIQHTGEKPYQCSICVEYFSQAAALEEHHQKMHKKGKECIPTKDRTCKFCDAIFSTIAELVCHSQKECAYL